MRMMIAAAALLLPATASTSAELMFDAMPVAGKLPPRCERPDRLKVSDKRKATAQRLGDMPPAQEIKTIYRNIDGCPDPIVVRGEVGTPQPTRPTG